MIVKSFSALHHFFTIECWFIYLCCSPWCMYVVHIPPPNSWSCGLWYNTNNGIATFGSGTRKPNEINYGMVQKEVSAPFKFWICATLCWYPKKLTSSLDIQPRLRWFNLQVSIGGWKDGSRFCRIVFLKLGYGWKRKIIHAVPSRSDQPLDPRGTKDWSLTPQRGNRD